MAYRLVVFDFDGTLGDSFPFFARVFNALADAHGFRRVDVSEAKTLRDSDAREIMRHVGLPAWKLPRVARDFTQRMRENASSIPLFDGIADALTQLSQCGVCLAIVSSNAQATILEVLGPASAGCISEFECGMSIFGKSARLRKVLRRTGIPGHQALYVGDQTMDLDAAREASMAAGAVGWGYASAESLKARQPDEFFERVEDLRRLAKPLSARTPRADPLP